MCPEKATQSTSSAARSSGRWAADCAASRSTRAPCRRAMAVRRSTGHSSPGDVRRGGEHDERPARDAVRCRRAARRAPSRAAPRRRGRCPARAGARCRGARHGSSVAWCSEAKTRTVVSRGSARASRLTESVVLRVKTTTSSSRAPDEAGDLVARGLVVGARHPREPARAAVHRGVRARRGLDGTGDPLERRRGCRVVEVRVVDEVARQGGDEVGPHDGGQVLAGARLVAVRHARAGRGRERRDGIRHGAQPRTAVEGGGGGAGDRHGGISGGPRTSDRPGIPRLPAPKGSPTRSSPGAPHRGGGLLASEPGLATSTHDLRRRV